MPIPDNAQRILIIDDDPIFTSVAQSILKAEGYITSISFDGADALELLDRHPVDLCVVDLVMPRVDGLRLIAHLRSDNRFMQLPIIVVSSKSDAATRERAESLGVSAMHSKPVDWPVVVAEIRSITAATKRELT
ncbi:MAG: response regulator [Hyphomicrobium sp.]|nr:response regulator [Hyphomicrobium sp.]